jgi:hypothetical protein
MDEKECSVCKIVLNLTRFENDNGRVRTQCKSCRLKQIHASRQKRKDMPKKVPESKACSHCEKTKLSSQFNKDSLSIDGLSRICRECQKITRCKKTSKSEVSTKLLFCGKCNLQKSVSEFRPYARAKSGYFSTCNACWKPKEWNKEKQKISERKYILNNPDKIKEKNARRAKNPQRIIKQRLSARIKCAMTSASSYKTNKTVHYIGCDIPYFRKWLEFQFVEGMNWECRDKWHIDHVRPCASFNLLYEEQQKTCFNWKNMRPCWKTENMEKSDKIKPELIAAQEELVKRFLEVNPLPT